MIRKRYWQQLLLIVAGLPIMGYAQQYNHVYDFISGHNNSKHTAAVQITNNKIVAGSSIQSSGVEVVQLSMVDPITGLTSPTPFVYASPEQISNKAVDLVESDNDPDWVIVVSNYVLFPGGPTAIAVYKTDPATGSIAWARYYGNEDESHFASAIKSDGNGTYFILGDRYHSSGMVFPYLISIDDSGSPNWEFFYPNTKDWPTRTADLLYDENNDVVIITAMLFDPVSPVGALIAEIDAGSGLLTNSKIIRQVWNVKDFVIRDIELVNGNYVLVGRVNVTPAAGFLLQFQPGLIPHSTFSQVYYFNNRYTYLTGIKPGPSGDMYASYDYYFPGNPAIPGLVELDADGFPLSSYLYIVDEYIESVGLVDIFLNQGFVIKGATGYTSGSTPELSLVSTLVPLNADSKLCPEEIEISISNDAIEEEFDMFEENIEQTEEIDIEVWDHSGKIFNCKGKFKNYFRMAPTGMEEEYTSDVMAVYPNPSNGLVTLEWKDVGANTAATAAFYNILGEVVLSRNINHTTQKFDLSDMPSGIYLLKVMTANGAILESHRILKD